MTPENAAEAHRSAIVCAFLGVVGTGLGVFGFWDISGQPLRVVQGVGIAINATALWVLSRRGRQTLTRSQAIFLLVLVPTAVMAWLVDDARAAHSAHWVPYEPSKLSSLTLAMIAPPGWGIGLVAIGMFICPALVHHALLSDRVRAAMAEGEPFGVIAYGVFAIVLLGFKQRSHVLNGELEHARSEKVILERVARVAMALRDLANTPIQTLELIRQALLKGGPAEPVQIERMGRALERLRRLNDILVPYQTAVKLDDRNPRFEAELMDHKARAQPATGEAYSGDVARTPPARPARRRPA